MKNHLDTGRVKSSKWANSLKRAGLVITMRNDSNHCFSQETVPWCCIHPPAAIYRLLPQSTELTVTCIRNKNIGVGLVMMVTSRDDAGLLSDRLGQIRLDRPLFNPQWEKFGVDVLQLASYFEIILCLSLAFQDINNNHLKNTSY